MANQFEYTLECEHFVVIMSFSKESTTCLKPVNQQGLELFQHGVLFDSLVAISQNTELDSGIDDGLTLVGGEQGLHLFGVSSVCTQVSESDGNVSKYDLVEAT